MKLVKESLNEYVSRDEDQWADKQINKHFNINQPKKKYTLKKSSYGWMSYKYDENFENALVFGVEGEEGSEDFTGSSFSTIIKPQEEEFSLTEKDKSEIMKFMNNKFEKVYQFCKDHKDIKFSSDVETIPKETLHNENDSEPFPNNNPYLTSSRKQFRFLYKNEMEILVLMYIPNFDKWDEGFGMPVGFEDQVSMPPFYVIFNIEFGNYPKDSGVWQGMEDISKFDKTLNNMYDYHGERGEQLRKKNWDRIHRKEKAREKEARDNPSPKSSGYFDEGMTPELWKEMNNYLDDIRKKYKFGPGLVYKKWKMMNTKYPKFWDNPDNFPNKFKK